MSDENITAVPDALDAAAVTAATDDQVPPEGCEWVPNPLPTVTGSPAYIAVPKAQVEAFLAQMKASGKVEEKAAEEAVEIVLAGPDGKPLKRSHLKSQRGPLTYVSLVELEDLLIAVDLMDRPELVQFKNEVKAIQALGDALDAPPAPAAPAANEATGDEATGDASEAAPASLDILDLADALAERQQTFYLAILKAKVKGWSLADPFDIDAFADDLELTDVIDLVEGIVRVSSVGRATTNALKASRGKR